jgi:hypothetical protein
MEEYTKNLLKECNCTNESYTGIPVETIESDLRLYCKQENTTFPYPISDMANYIYKISTTDRGWYPKIEVEIDGDASHCGYTDLYPNVEENLKDVINSGMPFKFSGSSKKEIGGFMLSRELKNGEIKVTAFQAMDEGYDLVSDSLPEEIELKLSEEEFDMLSGAVLELWAEGDECGSETEESEIISGDSTLEQILEKVDELQDICSDRLQESFEAVKNLTNYFLDHKEELIREEKYRKEGE